MQRIRRQHSFSSDRMSPGKKETNSDISECLRFQPNERFLMKLCQEAEPANSKKNISGGSTLRLADSPVHKQAVLTRLRASLNRPLQLSSKVKLERSPKAPLTINNLNSNDRHQSVLSSIRPTPLGWEKLQKRAVKHMLRSKDQVRPKFKAPTLSPMRIDGHNSSHLADNDYSITMKPPNLQVNRFTKVRSSQPKNLKTEPDSEVIYTHPLTYQEEFDSTCLKPVF